MRKVIGIVGEGPTDYLVLKTVIDKITGERNIYRRIQPEQDMKGEFGNGWKGVYRWCENNADALPTLFDGIVPGLDMLIIQMDGDVSRKEKEAHCHCEHFVCEEKDNCSPLQCRRVKTQSCPVTLPCPDHEAGPQGYRDHLQDVIHGLLGDIYNDKRVVITIPCDSSDSWIVAAYDDIDYIENICDPWLNIISAKKDYHNVRIPGHKKSITVYKSFMPTISSNWEAVTERCESAKLLTRSIKKAFLDS